MEVCEISSKLVWGVLFFQNYLFAMKGVENEPFAAFQLTKDFHLP